MGKLAWRAGRRTAALSVLVGVVPAAGAARAQAVRIKELSAGLTSKDHAGHSAAGSDGDLRFAERWFYRTGRVTPRRAWSIELSTGITFASERTHHGGPGRTRPVVQRQPHRARYARRRRDGRPRRGVTPGSGPAAITQAGPEDDPWLAEQGGQIGPTIVEPAKPNPPIVVTNQHRLLRKPRRR